MDVAADHLRLIGFVAAFCLCLLGETALPRRARGFGRFRRWKGNLTLFTVDVLALRLLTPLLPIAMASWATVEGVGLLNALPLPSWASILLALLALDLTIWTQHWAFHRFAILWVLHRVHHGDADLDVTTGVRFHPAEIVFSAMLKTVIVVILGIPVVAIVAFEIALNMASLFTHANLAISARLDHALRHLTVTPDMHRVHHSVHAEKMNSNFGTILPWWDRWFGTYRSQPRDGHDAMTLGVHGVTPEFRALHLLSDPWRAP